MSNLPAKSNLYESIRNILVTTRSHVRQTINERMVQAYWQIYLAFLIHHTLCDEFGKIHLNQSLGSKSQWYLAFSILSALWRELQWSHFKCLLGVKNQQSRLNPSMEIKKVFLFNIFRSNQRFATHCVAN